MKVVEYRHGRLQLVEQPDPQPTPPAAEKKPGEMTPQQIENLRQVISTTFGIPSYFILDSMVIRYRDELQKRLNELSKMEVMFMTDSFKEVTLTKEQLDAAELLDEASVVIAYTDGLSTYIETVEGINPYIWDEHKWVAMTE